LYVNSVDPDVAKLIVADALDEFVSVTDCVAVDPSFTEPIFTDAVLRLSTLLTTVPLTATWIGLCPAAVIVSYPDDVPTVELLYAIPIEQLAPCDKLDGQLFVTINPAGTGGVYVIPIAAVPLFVTNMSCVADCAPCACGPNVRLSGVTLTGFVAVSTAYPDSVAGNAVGPDRSNAVSPMPVNTPAGTLAVQLPASYSPTVVEFPSPYGGL
jgi:hypothetical protein